MSASQIYSQNRETNWKMEDDLHLVKLNLRGTIFVTDITKFQLFPNSRLGLLYRHGHILKTNQNEYFFDRNPILFHFILDIYEDRELHIPKNVCSTVIRKELQYWKLEEDILGKCCLHAFYQDDCNVRIHSEYTELFSNELNLSKCHINTTEENKEESGTTDRRERIWRMISDPYSSTMSKAYFTVIALMVLTSILVFAMSTVDTFRHPRGQFIEALLNSTNKKTRMYATTKQDNVITSLDLISNTVLALDVILAIYSTPHRWRILKQWYRITDLLVVLFVYVFNIIEQTDFVFHVDKAVSRTFATLIAIAYCFRILRITRLISHTPGVIALKMTFISKASSIFYFFVAFLSVCIFSATLLYHAELWTSSSFDNMFVSIWWAVVTISTVGYGDVVPLSIEGKVIAVVSVTFGLLIVTIPFIIITSDYGNYYACNEIIRHHERNMKDSQLKKSARSQN